MRRVILLILAVLALELLAGARPALAHAIVVRTEPADGAVLGAPPRQIRLWFSEPVALHLTSIELVDGAGRAIAIAGVRGDAASLAAAVRADQPNAAEVLIDLPSLPPSVYRLSWKTLSSTDLHNTAGMIVFGVQRATAGSAAAIEPLPAPQELALRWIDLGALGALLGALALALLALPRAARAPGVPIDALDQVALLRRRLLALAEWAGIAALLAGLALLLAQALAVGGSLAGGLAAAWEIMSGTSYGLAWLARQVALGLLIASLSLTSQRAGQLDPRRFVGLRASAPLALALVVVLAQALQSHAAGARDLPALAVAAGAAHVLAAGVWGGGLLALAAVVLPLTRTGAPAALLGWALLRAFGRLAAASLALLLVSGLLLVGQQVASVDALIATLYGRALLLKLGLVAGVALLGLLNAARLHGWVAGALGRLLRRPAGWAPFGGARLAAHVRAELAGALLVLGLAAVLAAATPARGPAFDPPAVEPLASSTSRADDLVVTLALKPNRPGQNFITLGVFDTRRPAPAPIDQVLLDLRAPAGLPGGHALVARALGKGRYEVADDAIASAGEWTIAVTARRAGLPDATTALSWTVLPPALVSRPVLISNAPLRRWAVDAALLAALALAALWAGLRWRAQSHIPSPISASAPFVAEPRLSPHPEEAV